MNHVYIMGRLTADPELKQSQSGNYITTFSVAVDNGKDKNGEKLPADFPRCVAFGNTAEMINKWFHRGDGIIIEGKLKTGSYDDSRHPDVKHYTTDVYVFRVEFPLGKAQSQQTQQGQNYGGGYGAPAQAPQGQPTQQAPAQAMTEQQSLTLADFEDGAISDGDLPF